MAITISGTTGIAGVDGSAGTPAVQGNDSNTGIYFPAADTIGFVCGGTEDFRVDGDGQLWNTINSEVGTDYTTLYKGYLCRAWVNFDGTTNTGGFCTIRASGNVTSVADNGTGNYTVNFTTTMPDTNYAVVCGASALSSSTSIDTWANGYVFTTTSVRIAVESNASTPVDRDHVSVTIFR